MPRSTLILLLLIQLFIPVNAEEQGYTAVDEAIQEIEHELEAWRHDYLAQIQAHPGVRIKPFTTDGCSGGLSKGWQHMARVLPVFKRKFGKTPPWEACCVTHDRDYWQGESRHGFTRRLQADQTLRQCVIDYGLTHSDEYARQFNLSKTAIEKHFAFTAELMYRAVRAGGMPCTILSWRWGYGWPYCQLDKTVETP